MAITEHFKAIFLTGEAFRTPAPANENLQLKPSWMTSAELMQFIRQEKDLLCREVAADPSLLADPKHRLWREETKAYEACALWHLYGVR
jgi:hypothetical protein